MTTRRKLAFWLYGTVLFALTGWGMSFMLRSEFTSYHAVAVGMPWGQVPPPLQILVLALIKTAGGLWVAFTLSVFVVLLIPFRRGQRWALWAVPLLIMAQFVAPMPAMTLVSLSTPATPPWAFSFFGLGTVLFALVVTVTERQRG